MINKINKHIKLLIINSIANAQYIPSKLRGALYNLCGMKISKSTHIRPNCLFNNSNIIIQDGTFINYSCIFECQEKVRIGKNCSIGMEVMFCTATHKISNPEKRVGDLIGKHISIEDGCWIGSRVTILPGITIEKGCVIGAGSLITKDCKKNGLYVGSPARRIKDL